MVFDTIFLNLRLRILLKLNLYAIERTLNPKSALLWLVILYKLVQLSIILRCMQQIHRQRELRHRLQSLMHPYARGREVCL